MFPSPYWGLFFYRFVTISNITCIGVGFRPRTGDYFFIVNVMYSLIQRQKRRSFRPRTGDYFFIQ